MSDKIEDVEESQDQNIEIESEKLVNVSSVREKKEEHPGFYFLTEAVLIWGWLPTILFFILGAVNGLLLLVEQDNYDICVFGEKIAKVISGDDPNDVSDMLEWNLIGSSIVAWTHVIVYSQILFSMITSLYKYTGLIYVIVMVGSLAFHIVAAVWLSNDKCDGTSYYKMGIVNAVYFFTFFILMFTLILILFLRGIIIYSRKQSQNKDKEQDALAESEERMVPEKDNPKGDLKENDDNKNNEPGNTDDEKKTSKRSDKNESELKEKVQEDRTNDPPKEEKKEALKDLEEEEDIY